MDTPVPDLPPGQASSEPERPLLPVCLTHPGALLGLWALPLGLLLLLNHQGYDLIGGTLSAEARKTAHLFGWANLLNLLLPVGLWLVSVFAREPDATRPPPLLGTGLLISCLVVQVAFLWFALAISSTVVPWSTARWIYTSDRFLFNQFSFAMLPLAHAALCLAGRPRKESLGNIFPLGFVTAIGVLFVLFWLTLALGPRSEIDRAGTTVVVGMVLFVCLCLFIGGLRLLLRGLHHARRWSSEREPVLVVLIALILPVCGLALNTGMPFPADFAAEEVFILTLANAGILLIASLARERVPVLCFGLLCASFPFSLYFFIVFLPYLPLAIPGALFFGLGLLLLAPTLLFVLHLHLLQEARLSAARTRPTRQVFAVGFLCALALPGTFVGRGLADRAALHSALDYVYTPAIGAGDIRYTGSRANLRRALDSHQTYKDGANYPLLSDFNGWLVFDRLVLPDEKLARLEQTFFGQAGEISGSRTLGRSRDTVRNSQRTPPAVATLQTVAARSLAIRTAPAGAQNTLVTFSFKLIHTAPQSREGAEYVQTLPLPPGVFARGFRLSVNGTLTPGRLVERKTALWVYSMIRDRQRRDPGILHYVEPGTLELRVFPVLPSTPSTVEIDFLFPGLVTADAAPAGSNDLPAVLSQLAQTQTPQLTRATHGTLVALPAGTPDLAPVKREPYLHLIVDRSLGTRFDEALPGALTALRRRFPAAQQARITLANYEVVDLVRPLVALDELAARVAPDLDSLLPAGGTLDVDLAVAHALRLHRDTELNHAAVGRGPPPRPIFVILSRHAEARLRPLDHVAQWADLVPSLELHERGTDGTWFTHRSTGGERPLLRLGDCLRPLAADRPTSFTPSAETTRVEHWDPVNAHWQPLAPLAAQASTPWSRAADLHLIERDYARSPGDAGPTLKSMVYASRESGLLLPETSYIVVEDSAQWKMLEASERQKLGQNAALDFRETPAPPAWWLAAGFIGWLAWRHRRRLRATASAPQGEAA